MVEAVARGAPAIEADEEQKEITSEEEKAFELRVLRKLLEMHDLPPCDDAEACELALVHVFEEKYESNSQV